MTHGRRRAQTRNRLALAVLGSGLLNLASALTPPDRSRVHVLARTVDHAVIGNATATAAMTGVMLVLLAGGVRRGKRRAWGGAIVALAAGAVAHLLKGLDVEEAVATLGVLLWLSRRRSCFTAKPDPVTRTHAAWLALGLMTFSLSAGTLLLATARPTAVQGDRTPANLLLTVLRGLVGDSGPLDLVGHRGDTLGYFALRDDRVLLATPTRKAAVSFRLVGGVALAAGDPLGDPEAWPAALGTFLQVCEEHGWVPAAIGVSEAAAEQYARLGSSVLELGDEAVLDPAALSLSGRAARGLRQAVSRATRAGVVTTVRRASALSSDEVQELTALAEQWRDGPHERGYSMALNRLGDPRDGDCVVAVARGADGRPQALLHLVPWGTDGLSLDLMRRAPAAPGGVVELLITEFARAAATQGVRRISLNFAMFRDVLERGARVGAGPLIRLQYKGILLAGRFWQLESLYRFNRKFSPTWQPRFLVYPGAADLPRVALATLRAEAFLGPVRKRPGRAPEHGAEPCAVSLSPSSP